MKRRRFRHRNNYPDSAIRALRRIGLKGAYLPPEGTTRATSKASDFRDFFHILFVEVAIVLRPFLQLSDDLLEQKAISSGQVTVQRVSSQLAHLAQAEC
ncbi:hypothetical protein [Mycobacterium sp. C31M]